MKYIFILINAAVLVYGGVIDLKRREIPDVVPIALLMVGIFLNFSLMQSIIGFIVPAMLLFATAKITESEVPGGDLKLLCSIGFACGLPILMEVLLISAIGALAYGLICRLPVTRRIPLCSYIAPAYILLQTYAIALERGG